MIKKVVIAAAGQGTRMMQLTKNKSKHLIKVNDRPFLAYVFDNLLAAGYEDIILVVGFGAEHIKGFLKENNYKATVLNQYEILGPKEKMYGTACPLMCVQEIKEQFLFICGDNLFSVDDLGNMAKDDDFNYVAGLVHTEPDKYGVLIKDGELLREIIEKPKDYVGNLINAGLYKFTPEVFSKLPLIKKSSRGEYEITDVITLLAKDRKVKVVELKDKWLDFGNPGDIAKCAKYLKSKK